MIGSMALDRLEHVECVFLTRLERRERIQLRTRGGRIAVAAHNVKRKRLFFSARPLYSR
jgi:hypothetical protein